MVQHTGACTLPMLCHKVAARAPMTKEPRMTTAAAAACSNALVQRALLNQRPRPELVTSFSSQAQRTSMCVNKGAGHILLVSLFFPYSVGVTQADAPQPLSQEVLVLDLRFDHHCGVVPAAVHLEGLPGLLLRDAEVVVLCCAGLHALDLGGAPAVQLIPMSQVACASHIGSDRC